MPKIARAAAQSFMALGGDRDAADILARSLEREWNPDLVALYAECRPADGTPQLEQAERWLARTATTRRCCTRWACCASARSCGARRRRTSRRASRIDDAWRTRVALGELFAHLGRDGEANAHLAAALKLALAELEPG